VTRSVLDQSKNHYLGLDSAYRSAQARIAKPDGELRSGTIISLRIVLDKRLTLEVPAVALLDTQGKSARVFVVAGHDRLKDGQSVTTYRAD
jgi:hypothetical protein